MINKQFQNLDIRFDVIGIEGYKEQKIDWIKNAF